MEHALAELPLAVFTTLAPIGAGAFITLAIAFVFGKFSDEELKKIDKMTLIPMGLILVGFVASFFHLTQPLNAINVLSGIGSSPLSNEIIIGSFFVVLALIYLVLALMGKLCSRARKALSVVVAVVALIFAVFVGMAYMMETIQSWNTPYTVVEIIGFTLIGGATLGSVVLGLAGSLGAATTTAFKPALFFLTVLGGVAAAGALVAHVMMVGDMSSMMISGSDLTSELTGYMGLAAVALVAATLLEIVALVKSNTTLAGVACIAALAGVFIARLVFYGLYLSVGL